MSEEEEKKSWKERIPTFIAMTTLLLAVCATLAAFKAAGYGNRMVLAQNQASDQWAYYQAKSIKETMYQIQQDSLQNAIPPELRTEAMEKQRTAFEKEAARFRQEKADIAKEAQRLEELRNTYQKYNSIFGQSLIFLQVGILLSSLASINKAHGYWYAGAGIGAVGIAYFLYALVLP